MITRRISIFSKQIFEWLAAIIILVGCTVGPDYQRPNFNLPSNYPEILASENERLEEGSVSPRWWTLYEDPMLDVLVSDALKNNTDIRKAIAQIDEAEDALTIANSGLFPEIDLSSSVNKSRSSTLTAQPLPPGTPVVTRSNKITLSTVFELDFWGKLRRTTEAARAEMLGTRFAKDVLALTLAGTVAQTYFTLRLLDTQISVTESILSSRKESLKVVKSRASGGLASDLEVNQAEGAFADAALQLHDLKRQRTLVLHQLANLTGRLELKIAPGDLMSLAIPALPPIGIPSTLLERRPDVRQAEQALVSANAQIGIAKSALFPTFTLTGSYGGQSESISNLFRGDARIWAYGPSVSLPIFDAGRYSARTRQAEARQRQSLANYQKTVETAFKEVADAMINIQQTSAAMAAVQTKVDAARNALRLSRLRYEAGYESYLVVLDAMRTANVAELTLIQYRQAQITYSVDLMKALGGGWSPAGALPIGMN